MENPAQPSPENQVPQFTPRAQKALAFARKEADLLDRNFVGTEHVLLGLIALGQGAAVTVLNKLGLDLENTRKEIEKQFGRGPDEKIIGNIPYTPRVKKILRIAAKYAALLGHTFVGTEHTLLGLLREDEGPAAKVFKSFKIDLAQTRKEILKELDPNFQEPDDESNNPKS